MKLQLISQLQFPHQVSVFELQNSCRSEYSGRPARSGGLNTFERARGVHDVTVKNASMQSNGSCYCNAGTHYAFIHRLGAECTTGVIQVRQASFTSRKVECRACKAGNPAWGLFARPTINFSVFIRVMISLLATYYKYASYYSILAFLCINYAVIEWNWKIFCNYLIIYKQSWE